MQRPEKNSARYQLRKQAVFDALYNCCEVNENDQVSLPSVLRYISKEIESNFRNSECIINELKQMLISKSQEGWLSFVEVCEILNTWMDDVSRSSISDCHQKNFEALECTSHKQMNHQPIPPSPRTRKNVLNGGIVDMGEVLLSKCEKCGRDENCCEWRKNEISREEKITRCYEQKVTELQNLLRQSEDCNSLIQLENDSLRQNNILLQNKEQRWIAKEEEFKERDHQMSSANTLLREQTIRVEKEIQNLKHQLSHLKTENSTLVRENLFLEEKVADIFRLEKLLSEARLQQVQLQIDLQAKDVIVADLEAKLEQNQEYSEVLEAQIREMKNIKSAASSVERIHEQSLGEEIMIADMSDESSFRSNDMIALNVHTENSLKAELDACGQWPLLFEHMAVQATPDLCTAATQTGEDLASDVYRFSETVNNCGSESVKVLPNIKSKDEKLVFAEQFHIISSVPSYSTSATQTDDDDFEVYRLLKPKSINQHELKNSPYPNYSDDNKKLVHSEQIDEIPVQRNVLSAATQTDKDFLASDVYEHCKSITYHGQENTQFHHDKQYKGEKHVLSEHLNKYSTLPGAEAQIPKETFKFHSDISSHARTQHNAAPVLCPLISQNMPSLYVPIVPTLLARRYQSTYEMELVVTVNTSTQTDAFIAEELKSEIAEDSYTCEVASENQVSKIRRKKKFISFLNVNLPCISGNVMD